MTDDLDALVDSLSEEQMQDLIESFTPRIVEPYFRQTPTPVQQLALSLPAKELFFGGSGGGGKSSWLLMAALQYIDVPGYSALILRRTWPDLNAPQAILDRFKEWMAPFVGNGEGDVKMRDQGRLWIFPSGAKISFGYLQREDQKYKFAGGEYQFIAWDELTHFEENSYSFLFSRLRKPSLPCLSCQKPLEQRRSTIGKIYYQHVKGQNGCAYPLPDPQKLNMYEPAPDGTTVFDVPLRMFSASNPGGLGHSWVKRRLVEGNVKEDQEPPVFIPASLQDNPYLNAEEYVNSLQNLSTVEKARMLAGDWDVMPDGGMFDRGNFNVLKGADAVHPDDCKQLVRSWDLAASENNDSDWTVGALCGITPDGRWVILDLKRVRYLPHKVEALVKKTAREDGNHVRIIMEQEPGSSGKGIISHYARKVLPGYMFKGQRPTGSKETRAEIVASQSGVGNLYMNESVTWNTDLLDEFASFPHSAHDDIVDAVSGGFNFLHGGSRVRILA